MKRFAATFALALALCALLPTLVSAQTAEPSKEAFLGSLQASADSTGPALGKLLGIPAPTNMCNPTACRTGYNLCVSQCNGDPTCLTNCANRYEVCQCSIGCSCG